MAEVKAPLAETLMKNKISFRKFAASCAEEARMIKRHGDEYFKSHLGRFYRTFTECFAVMPPGARTLSVGAGGAYVEKQLAASHGAKVTVVDFPEAIKEHEEDYRRHGFEGIGLNLAEEQLETDEPFDVVLSFEIAEHLPVAIHQHFKRLSELLKPGGYFILSTPNIARLPNVFQLLRGRSILPDARLVFSPVSYDNEGVHRREYVAAEIVDAMCQANLSHEKTVYIESCRNRLSIKGQVQLLFNLVPRWKKIILVVGRKEAA